MIEKKCCGNNTVLIKIILINANNTFFWLLFGVIKQSKLFILSPRWLTMDK